MRDVIHRLRHGRNDVPVGWTRQLFLGLDDADVGRAIAGRLVAEYIDYRPPPQGTVRRLTLLDTGREAARDAQLRRPAPATIPVVYDRLAKAVTPGSIGARPPSVSSCVMWSSHQAGRVLVENAAELSHPFAAQTVMASVNHGERLAPRSDAAPKAWSIPRPRPGSLNQNGAGLERGSVGATLG
jgi:hypothetical protein